jgi:hypothetical protein
MKRLLLALGLITPLVLQAQAVPQLRLDKQLSVGDAVSGDITFTKVVAVVPGPTASFYVADAEDKSLRQFDRSGKLLRGFGRKGNGPGEFGSLDHVGRSADSIWVMDGIQKRISLFTPNGEFVRTVAVPPLGDLPPVVRAAAPPTLLLQNGTHVRTHGLERYVIRVDGARMDTLATLRYGVGDWVYRVPGNTPYEVLLPNPFNDATLFATDSKGGNLTVVHRLVGETNAFEVERLDARGKSVWKRTFSYTPRSITTAVKDSVIRRPEFRAIAKFPKHMPAVSNVIAGEDGSVWLRREELGSAGRSEWNMLSADGRIIGRFETAKRFQLHNAQGRELLGVEFDANNAPTVVRYAVVPVR